MCSTDSDPLYHALSVHLRRAKWITRFNDRYAVAKVRSLGEGSGEKYPDFSRYLNFLVYIHLYLPFT